MNQSDIINRLRRYPSIGMGLFEDGLEAAKGLTETGIQALNEALQELANTTGQFGPNLDKLRASISGMTNDANNLSQALEYNTQQQEAANASFLAGVKSITYLLQREKELTKALGITAKSSAYLSQKYSEVSTRVGISIDLTNKYRLSLDKLLPGLSANIAQTGKWGDSLYKTTDLLRQHIGLTGEQTNALTLAAAATGTDLESSVKSTALFAKAYESATGEIGAFKNIMSDVANTSIELRMEYSKFPHGLELATIKARKLGMSMADIDAAATSLLDIESSVGKELEYQLISGQRLVDESGNSLTNKMREAKMAGDAEGQANAMTEILTTQSAILDGNNFLAKKALAEATGLTVAQLQGANANLKLQKQVYEQMSETDKLTAGKDGKPIKSAIELTSEDLKAAIEKMPKAEKDVALETLKTQQSLLTPAEQQVDLLKIIADNGVKLLTGGGFKNRGKTVGLTDLIENQTTGIDQSRKDFQEGTAIYQKPDAEMGRMQTIAQMQQNYANDLKEYATTLPTTTNKLVTTVATSAEIASKFVYGMKIAKADTIGTATSTETEDAFMMHDGVIKFDDRDKFTMIASPYGAMHESVADKITGGGGGSGFDANVIAKAIQQAIQAGLSNVSWAVNLDPMAVDKAIKFNSGRLNS
jgi:hypothetical protein